MLPLDTLCCILLLPLRSVIPFSHCVVLMEPFRCARQKIRRTSPCVQPRHPTVRAGGFRGEGYGPERHFTSHRETGIIKNEPLPKMSRALLQSTSCFAARYLFRRLNPRATSLRSPPLSFCLSPRKPRRMGNEIRRCLPCVLCAHIETRRIPFSPFLVRGKALQLKCGLSLERFC